MILIGYGGHGYVAYCIAKAMGKEFTGYCDIDQKEYNPFNLEYFGSEQKNGAIEFLKKRPFFIAIGYNEIRRAVFQTLAEKNIFPINLIHPSAVICPSAAIGHYGIMIASNVCINPLSKIGKGAICNTGCIIEHECQIGDFAHIGPGAVLCGNVHIGENSFVGAKSVIREEIKIGKNVIIGAGSVVVKDIPDNSKVAGNPARPLS
ncbi:MAG: acetyltransferase [Ginsengibacter sp.]